MSVLQEEILHRIMVLQDQMNRLLPMVEAFRTKVNTTEKKIMVTLQDVQDKADAELAQIKAETDVVTAVKAVVDNQNAKLDDLKAQLAAAGVDPVKLQALADTIDAIQAADTSNAKVVSDAVVAGTPVVPTPTPDPSA